MGCIVCFGQIFQDLKTLGQGQFRPQSHHLSKSGIGSLDDAIYQTARLVVSDKAFLPFPYISLCEICDTQAAQCLI